MHSAPLKAASPGAGFQFTAILPDLSYTTTSAKTLSADLLSGPVPASGAARVEVVGLATGRLRPMTSTRSFTLRVICSRYKGACEGKECDSMLAF